MVQEQVSSWEEAAFEDIEIDDLLHIGYVCNTKAQSDGFRESRYYDSEGSFNLWGSDSPKLASSVTVSGGLKISAFQGEDTLVIPRSKLRGRSLHVCWGYSDEVQECDTEVNSEAAEQMLTALEQKQDKHKKEEESK